MKKEIPLPIHLKIFLVVLLLQILVFTSIRLILFFFHFTELINIPFNVILESIWMGIRFDSVISAYIISVPLIVLSIGYITQWKVKFFFKICIIYTATISTIAFFIALAGIPFFNHYHSPITISVLDWIDKPVFVFKMIFTTWSFYPFLFLFFLFIALILYALKKVIRWFNNSNTPCQLSKTWILKATLISIISIAVVVILMRGRVAEKSPIRWGTAFFSPYPLPNQLALNPVFTFMQSWMERIGSKNQELNLISDEEAIKNMRQFFNIPNSSKFNSPIAREVNYKDQPNKQNVVIVIMESMAAWKMGWFGNPANLTPNLDSISRKSIVFNQFYSAGIHTFNGIYSTLFGLPSLLSKHPMKGTESIQEYSGIARILSKYGYQTIYFCTHDAEFDNMAGFLSNNGFQKIISEKDYPLSKIESTLGVPDHILFEEAIPRLNELSANQKPFFAAFLTASDHIPYIIPDGIDFHPKSSEASQKIVEYADWSIGYFLQQASKEKWFDNTIFIFVADHGSAHDSKFGMTLSAHHSTLIIFQPRFQNQSRVINTLSTQLDIYPTILGMLNISFVNNSFGTDLFRNNQRFICFNSDDVAGCLSDEYYLVRQKDGHESLYRYKQDEITDYRLTQSALGDSMSVYLRSFYQTTQWMIKKRMVGIY